MIVSIRVGDLIKPEINNDELNEVTWMQEPSVEMIEYGFRAICGVRPETAADWERLLEDAGLDIDARPKEINK